MSILDDFVRVDHRHVCPICEHADWCLIDRRSPENPARVICQRAESQIRWGEAGWLHVRHDDGEWQRQYTERVDRPKRNQEKVVINWPELVWCCEQAGVDKMPSLASQLAVSVEALHQIHAGWSVVQSTYTLPERNAAGEFIGINRRDPITGEKKRWPGASSGLIFSDGWNAGDREIFLVEGASDTAALITMGLNVVGRPSNTGGVDLLIDLLKTVDHSRPITVIGERDRKDHESLKPNVKKHHDPHCEGCSRCWPGWHGATLTAQKLADRLDRPIQWAMPPESAKDSRAWLNSNAGVDPPDVLGRRFAERIKRTTIHPNRPEIIPQDTRPVITLSDWRQELVNAKLDSIGKIGIFLDQSTTGAGKSHSDAIAVEKVIEGGGRAMILIQTHKQCRDLECDFREKGIRAVEFHPRVYKDLDEADGIFTEFRLDEIYQDDGKHEYAQNCWNENASKAEAMGLSVFSAVCISCPMLAYCQEAGYLHQHKQADQSPVAIATHTRGIHRGLEATTEGRNFVSIQEASEDLLRPSSAVSSDDIATAQQVLHDLTHNTRWLDWMGDESSLDENGNRVHDADKKKRRDALYTYTLHMARMVDHMAEEMATANRSTPFAMPATLPKPAGLENLLFRASTEVGVTSAAWGPLIQLAEGNISSATIQVSSKSAETPPQKSLFIVRNNPPPSNCTVWVSDATGATDVLREILGNGIPIFNATPAGRLERVQKVIQVPRDITRLTSIKTVLGTVRAIMAAHPEIERAGIVAHSNHTDALRSDKNDFAARVVKVEHWGSGNERASNDWHTSCDAVIVLGTPRPPQIAIERVLLRRGNTDAVNRSGGWGDRKWQGTTDAGASVVVPGKGYSDPAWKTAQHDTVRANLIQAIGRGRGILDEGVPVIVVSTEECGVTITSKPNTYAPMFSPEADVLAAVKHLSDLKFSGPVPLYISKQSGPLKSRSANSWTDTDGGVTTAAIGKHVGGCERVVRRHLESLVNRGLVIKIGKRGGWAPSRPPSSTYDTTAAAMLPPSVESVTLVGTALPDTISVTLPDYRHCSN